MAAGTTLIPSAATRIKPRTALIASADSSFRQRLGAVLSGLRWQVREAQGGAEAWGEALEAPPQTIIVDSWLPDLDVNEFVHEFRSSFPRVDVIANGEPSLQENVPGPFRQEVLYALQHTQDTDTAAWNTAPLLCDSEIPHNRKLGTPSSPVDADHEIGKTSTTEIARTVPSKMHVANALERIPELIGNSPHMLEVSKRIRRVAPRSTPVLIEGPTGSGKELVAEALQRLSTRSRKPFVAINCAAIPEALLEAELFGHTRGAFTGAVQGRVGRIEAADGGTLFLDEIAEMPLGLQSKLLRFVESGELQRIGDNELVRVDVRIIAATHQPLGKRAQSGEFRADLYYRLAVFLIRTPPLVEHLEDLPLLVEHFLERMGREMPVKRIDDSAMAMLETHTWPGNVRELEHVLERAAILAGDEPVLTDAEIDFGEILN
ncbi:MAG TPA: sigma-54 dependent transcriptional regulator [Terracidiphilus sp.]|jgi:DNA-binding NtrC family response regulator